MVKSKFIIFVYRLLGQFGIDPRKLFYAIKGVIPYFRDLKSFNKNYTGKLQYHPCLHDRYDFCGNVRNEYFSQDLLLAQIIFKQNPSLHIDIGSRLDGFIAHLASFREVDVIDIRPIDMQIDGVLFHQLDIMNQQLVDNFVVNVGKFPSVSCLHTIEHFGLGRYGDPVNPNGYRKGIEGLTKLVADNGMFYISVPVGSARVEFNANRVFDPIHIIECVEQYSFNISHFYLVEPNGRVNSSENYQELINIAAKKDYSLGIFVFKKC